MIQLKLEACPSVCWALRSHILGFLGTQKEVGFSSIYQRANRYTTEICFQYGRLPAIVHSDPILRVFAKRILRCSFRTIFANSG